MGRSLWLLVSCFLVTACTQGRPPVTGVPSDLKLDFGTVQVGGRFVRSLTVQNPSQKDGILEVKDVGPPFFALEDTIEIRADRTVTLHFAYAPASAGQDRLRARLELPGTEQGLLLAGAAAPPPVRCDDHLDFGTVLAQGEVPAPFTCSNDSSQDVILRAQVAESQGRFGVFEVQLPDVDGQGRPALILPAGGLYRSGAVILQPMYAGHLSGTLTLFDESGGIRQNITLDADVVPSWLSVAPDGDPIRFSFDTVPLGKGRTASVHLTNTGSKNPITLDVLGDASDGVFTVSVPPVLGPGEEGDLSVTFTPQENGLRSASFQVATSDPGRDILDLNVEGFGGGPQLVCGPPAVDFGTWALGEDRAATVHCDSVGPDDPTTTLDDLRVIALTAGGDFRAAAAPLPLLVPGGQGFDVSVTFTPTAAGSRSGQLSVSSSAGEVGVSLAGEGLDTSGCQPQLEPQVGLDFRRVPPGTWATLDASMHNQGTGPCLVRDVSLAPETAAAFSVQAPDSAVVQPGEALRLPVTVDPGKTIGRLTGRLVLWVEGSRALELTATVAQGCLRVTPAPLDLGRAPVGCHTLPTVMTVHDDCQDAAAITSIDLAGGSAPSFVLVSLPQLPLTLDPGGAATVTVAYVATQAGVDAGVLFTGPASDPLLAPLKGEGIPGGVPVDRFDTSPLGDVLVVVDDASRSAVADGLADFAASLVSDLDARKVSYNLGVTGTSIVACDDAKKSTPDGRLLPIGGKARVVTPATVLASDVFLGNLESASCSSTNNGLESGYRALHLPLIGSLDDPRHADMNDGNLGFLRDGAELSVVFLSASDDSSSHLPDYYAAHLAEAATVQHVSVAAGPAGGCLDVSDSPRYRDYADKSNGSFTSLCDAGWAKTAAKVVAGSIGKQRSVFPLSRVPPDSNGDGLIDEQDLAVLVDGLPVPASDALGAVWRYASDAQNAGSVVFADGRAPKMGAVVGIDYGIVCQ